MRIMIGVVFIVSAGEKLISPYQNFLYVIQGYQMFPSWGEIAVARIFPWIELITGVFLALGLWVEASLKTAAVIFCVFITVVGQAILRKLPLEHCGCFGQLIVLPLRTVILLDSALFLITVLLIRKLARSACFSLDNCFASS